MADDPSSPQSGPPRPLPHRDPRPLMVHVLVDTAICFLAVLVVGLILGFGWVVLLIASVVIGTAVAPFSHRAEAHALAERDTAGPTPGEDPAA